MGGSGLREAVAPEGSTVSTTVEPRYNEVPRDWQNVFAITRFRYIKVLFNIFSYYWGTKKSFVIPRTSLYRGSLYGVSTVLMNLSFIYEHKPSDRSKYSIFIS